MNNILFLLMISLFLFPSMGVAGTYWVSPTGTAASWGACQSATDPGGGSSNYCTLTQANSNAAAGDTAYLKGGTYVITGSSTAGIYPSKSGSQGNLITFSAAPSETPIITGATMSDGFGFDIRGKSYIKVTGITFQYLARFGQAVEGSNHLEFSYNTWKNSPGTSSIGLYFYAGNGSAVSHIWFHHNTLGDIGILSPDCNAEYGALIYLGVANETGGNFNTFENNVMYHAAHHLIETHGQYDVIKNNVAHNDAFLENIYSCRNYGSQNGYYGHRNFSPTNGDMHRGAYALWEGNRSGHAGQPVEDDGGHGMELAAPKTIIRYNSFYNNTNNGLYFKNEGGDYNLGNDCRIYNNTFFKNGYKGYNQPQFSGTAIRFRNDIKGNMLKNNLLYDNYSGDFECAGSGGYCDTYRSLQLSNNWCASAGTGCSATGDPKFVNTDVSDPTSLTLPNLNLQSTSSAIDGGTYLTQANASGTNSTTLVVDDAFYFQDGTWGSDLARGVTLFPDWIAIGTVGNVAQISSINYSTNTITLASPMTWSNGAKIWLYKKSDGTRVLYGYSPDHGAFEFESGEVQTPAPAPPKNLRIQ